MKGGATPLALLGDGQTLAARQKLGVGVVVVLATLP